MEIKGTRLLLRDSKRASDKEDFFRWRNLEEWQYYDGPDVPFQSISREEYEKQLEKKSFQSKPATSTSNHWQIDTLEGRHIGWVNYYQLDSKAKRVYIGICLPEEDVWTRGYGTEAVRLLVKHLFEEMDLKEIRTATWTGNKRMIRCAEKCAFNESGLMPHRAPHSVRGEPLERIEFTLTREEWMSKDG